MKDCFGQEQIIILQGINELCYKPRGVFAKILCTETEYLYSGEPIYLSALLGNEKSEIHRTSLGRRVAFILLNNSY